LNGAVVSVRPHKTYRIGFWVANKERGDTKATCSLIMRHLGIPSSCKMTVSTMRVLEGKF
jgi:hypothetical protein